MLNKLTRLTVGSLSPTQNAVNWLFTVKMKPDLAYPLGILAQEMYESELKRWRFPVWLVSNLTLRFTKTSAFHRDMEIVSHMIETILNVEEYNLDTEKYVREQSSILKWAYEQFSSTDITVSEIRDMMYDATEEAQEWIDNNEDRVEDYLMDYFDKSNELGW